VEGGGKNRPRNFSKEFANYEGAWNGGRGSRRKGGGSKRKNGLLTKNSSGNAAAGLFLGRERLGAAAVLCYEKEEGRLAKNGPLAETLLTKKRQGEGIEGRGRRCLPVFFSGKHKHQVVAGIRGFGKKKFLAHY